MGNNSLLNAMRKIANHRPEPFIAPVPDAAAITVFTQQATIPYTFEIGRLRDIAPGWYEILPTTSNTANLGRDAYPFEIATALESLPRFYVIAVQELAHHTWMVIPYNASDANQRGWLASAPKVLHIVRDTIEPFDILVARQLARTLIYDSVDIRLSNAPISRLCREYMEAGTVPPALAMNSNFILAFALIHDRLLAIRKEIAARNLANVRSSTEGHLRWMLEYSGASLNEWRERKGGYEVTWTHEGHTYTMLVRQDLHIESAGICLSGRDANENLSSIVAVMKKARDLGRPGANGNNDDDDDDDW